MYPEPEVCLDLKTWKEFYGFDQMDRLPGFLLRWILRHTPLHLMRQLKSRSFSVGQEKRMNLIDTTEKLKPVSTNPLTAGDFFGEARGEQSFPGPFTSIENKKVYFIDPRKKIY